ncbi:polysaccharide biosynthesis protein (plasmid) [Nicoliella spurrieriana]|uniref:Polysaccharide biosynthesis protein n=1 Tax=Nicoliella spurrieriana TaxID=2925830 RepID=A0A976X4T3_9LACO|nr:polysaccharide biosynthesis protein [Nicoliella spurrieriana]UQS86130.1 polysaccharide biosynthesis protein [Nicoliella spurrieriana]
MNKKMLSGSFWLSFGSIISRVLGIVYLIPWLIMIGSYSNQLNAQAVFNASYTPYALLIAVGTAGLPSVIARQVASLNSRNRYLDGVYVTKLAFIIMVLAGLICGIALYILAPVIARNSPVQSVHQAVISIRMLVPAIIILPSMSMIRGWFQGHSDMKPYGISQLWEQLSRVLFIIISTFVIIKVLHYHYIIAVYFSVFGAFVGSLISYLYLFFYGHHQRGEYQRQLAKSEPRQLNNFTSTILGLWYASIPFVLVGSCITISQLIDQVFFKQVLVNANHLAADYVNYLYTVSSANPSKITTIIISLVTSVSETSLPLFSELHAKKQWTQINKLLLENYKLLLFFMLPIVIIAGFASGPIYTILFTHDSVGTYYLVQNIIQSIFLGLAINVLTLLQSLHASKKAVIYMTAGIMVKLILQLPMLKLFGASGAIIATDFAFLIILLLGYIKINTLYGVKLGSLVPILYTNSFLIIIMSIFFFTIQQWFQPVTRFGSFLYLAIYGLFFLLTYVLIANRTGTAKALFGEPISYRSINQR